MPDSIAFLRTETKGVRPEFEHEERTVRTADRFPRDGGPVVQHRQRNQRTPRRWSLEWDGANEGQARFLKLRWAQALGQVLPMDYTPLGELDANSVQVTFVENSLVVTQLAHNRYRMKVEIEERP